MRKEALIKLLKEKEFSEKIIEAFKNVDRSLFVPDHLERFAYDDERILFIKLKMLWKPLSFSIT